MKSLGILLATANMLIAQQTTTPSSSTSVEARAMIRQWVKTERLISEEKMQWNVDQSHMRELLKVYQTELKLLTEELKKAGEVAQDVDRRREQAKKDIAAHREARQELKNALSRQLPRMLRILPLLPPPLQKEIAENAEVLYRKDAMEKPRDVLKSMLAILTSAARFNRTITVVEETRLMKGGKKRLVQVMYLGLARAYYAAASGDIAGIGIPQASNQPSNQSDLATNHWRWESRPELASRIRQAIAIYNKDKQPQLIQLPVSIHAPIPEQKNQ